VADALSSDGKAGGGRTRTDAGVPEADDADGLDADGPGADSLDGATMGNDDDGAAAPGTGAGTPATAGREKPRVSEAQEFFDGKRS
ncbi:MAG TPA: porin, partial [Arthrobacter sp.]